MARSPPTRNLRVRGRIACKPCRQSKVRCDLRESPCTRCDRLGLQCSVDRTYKRMNKHEKVEQLESQVRRLEGLVDQRVELRNTEPLLHARISSPPLSGSAEPGHEAATPAGFAHNSIHTASIHGEGHTQAPQTIPTQGEALNSRSIGSVTLGPERVEALFKIYFSTYHQFVPILEPARTASEYFDRSRLLFWSIIAVASRHFRQDAQLFPMIAPTLSELLWSSIASDQTTVSQVQAVIMLASWPLHSVRLMNDKSSILVNIAVISAMHLGMHRPGHEGEYSKNIDSQVHEDERTRTWVASMILSSSFSADFGHLSTAVFEDYSIDRACDGDLAALIPSDLRDNLLIQRCTFNSSRKLSRAIHDSTMHPSDTHFDDVINVLDQEFTAVETRISHSITYLNSLRLLSAKLFHRCLHLLNNTSSVARRIGVLSAYELACSFISAILSDHRSHEMLMHSPLGFLRSILCAACVIYRVLNSSYSNNLDRQAGQVLYNAAAFSMRQMSLKSDEKDIPLRAADMLNELWRFGEDDPTLLLNEPTLRVRTRLGASVTYDCLVSWRYYKAQQSVAQSADARRHGESRLEGTDHAATESKFLSSTSLQAPDHAGDIATAWDAYEDMSWMESFGFPNLSQW